MLPLCLAATALALLQQPAPAPLPPKAVSPTDEMLEGADLIAIGKVEGLHRLKGSSLELAELTLERVLYGPDVKRCFALPRDLKQKKVDVLEKGEAYVLFLELWPSSPIPKLQQEEAAGILQGSTLYACPAEGHWKRAADRYNVPKGVLPKAGGPDGVELTGNGDKAQDTSLLEWLEKRIRASVPSIRVALSSNGPSPWSFVIGPDLSIHGTGASVPALEAAAAKALWDKLESEHFMDLPESVGNSAGPDTPMGIIEVRTTAVHKRVVLRGDRLDGLSSAERDAAERWMRVWRTLPVDPSMSSPISK